MSSNGDRLSNLHDSLLRHIVSRLPTKDAVRTSILSKDWKHKWTLSCNVDTDIGTWGRLSTAFSFADFLDEMLFKHEYLTRLRVTFWGPGSGGFLGGFNVISNMVRDWINAALIHKLEYLDVNLNHNNIILPVSLLNHNSLIEIKVVQPYPGYAEVLVEDKNCAPNLTSLSLDGVVFLTRNVDTNTITFDFPALERLELRGAQLSYKGWMNVTSVEIYAPSLVSFLFEPPTMYILWPPIYSTKIVAPRLSSFSCVEGLPENLILDGSSVVSTFLSGWELSNIQRKEDFGAQATNLLNGFPNLEEMMLERRMAEVLRNAPPLQRHDKLKRLTLLIGCNAFQLFKLLHAIPSLKFLSVNVDEWGDYYEGMGITPSCIASNLEEVVLQNVSSICPQYKLAALLLMTAKNLKKLTITMNDVGAAKKMKEDLSTFYYCRSPSLEICYRLPDIEPTYTRAEF